MKELLCQIINGKLEPYTVTDQDTLAEFKPNQIVRVQCFGTQKERSYPQLKLFWKACATVARNTDDPHWNTSEKVAFQCKIATKLYDTSKTIVDSGGRVHLSWRSISFKEMRHLEACKFFDMAFMVMASKLGITTEELLSNLEEI